MRFGCARAGDQPWCCAGTPGAAPTVHWRPLLAGAALVGLVAGGVLKLIGPGARPAIERPAPSSRGTSRAEPSARDPLDQGGDSRPIPATDLPAGPDSSGPVATGLVPPPPRGVAQRSAKYRPALFPSNSEPATRDPPRGRVHGFVAPAVSRSGRQVSQRDNGNRTGPLRRCPHLAERDRGGGCPLPQRRGASRTSLSGSAHAG